MTASERRYQSDKSERALALLEKGISRADIAERLGVRPNNVNGMIERAKQRRAKATQQQENQHA